MAPQISRELEERTLSCSDGNIRCCESVMLNVEAQNMAVMLRLGLSKQAWSLGSGLKVLGVLQIDAMLWSRQYATIICSYAVCHTTFHTINMSGISI